jgi:hypothetical protein
MRASESLNSLLLKYVQVFNVQTTHTAIADARAHIDRRLARWILMAHDRTGDNTLRHVCEEYDGDVARDVAEKIGLIYAAGMLGIRCGLLPWGKLELLDALAKCYIGARELLPDDGVAVRQGIAALRAKLRQLPRVTKKRVKEIDFEESDGCRKREKKENRYVIKRAQGHPANRRLTGTAVSVSGKRRVSIWNLATYPPRLYQTHKTHRAFFR